MTALRRLLQLIGVAGIACCVAIFARMLITVIPGGSCGNTGNLPACSPRSTRALETLPISIFGAVLFILLLVFSSALIRPRSKGVSGVGASSASTSSPFSSGGSSVFTPDANISQLLTQLQGTVAAATADTHHPKWTVPDKCPNCGAEVDQATASYSDNPICPYCQAPIPVQPYDPAS